MRDSLSDQTSSTSAFVYWQVGTSAPPSASFWWNPSTNFEVTMLALKAGPSPTSENVVQETQGAFSSQSTWQDTLPQGTASGDSLVAIVNSDTPAAPVVGVS